MEHEKSLKALGLTKDSSLQELTSVFRKLVKKYHPDLNQDKQEWSNQKMLLINEAYDSAFKFLSTSPSERDSHPDAEDVEVSDGLNLDYSNRINLAMKYLYDGMSIYYQYGLENIPLRQEGTRRSRFRSSVRRIKKSFSIIKPAAELHLNKSELDHLEIIVNFIHHFYKSIHIKSFHPAENTPIERKAFQHYLFGSKLVDSVIKEIMFKEYMEPYKQGRLTENIKLAEAELNSVIIDFPAAICHRESELKKELLLSFLEMTDLNDMDLIDFY